jgi:AbrB family looped-hinge helix DNA binding protein
MSTVLQIRSNGQITLPTQIRRKARLKEGDLLEVLVEEDGSLRLVPKITIDRDQAYFWSERWQKGERETEEDLHAGRYKQFTSMNEMIKDLESEE